jgi:hypothetical protein
VSRFDREARIVEAISRMAVARGGAMDAGILEVYLDELGLVELEPFVTFCGWMGRQARGATEPAIPAVGNLLVQFDIWQRGEAAPNDGWRLPPGPGERTYRCAYCLDIGFVWLKCPERPCARVTPHYRHVYVLRCTCWLTAHAGGLRLSKQAALTKGHRIPQDVWLLEDFEAGRYNLASQRFPW